MREHVLRRAAVGTASLVGVACLLGFWASSPLLAGAVLLLAVAVVGRLVLHAVAHCRLARSLLSDSRVGSHGGVDLRWRPLTAGAVVAGLRRPAIFCDPELRDRLSVSELEAVILHERHHQLRRDPARLVALAAVAPMARLHPRGRQWLVRRYARIEVTADRHALDCGATRPALAGAIMKLGGASAPPLAAGFSSAQELRLRALVHDEDVLGGRVRRGVLGAAAVAAALLACVGAVAHHLLLPTMGGIGCLLAGC